MQSMKFHPLFARSIAIIAVSMGMMAAIMFSPSITFADAEDDIVDVIETLCACSDGGGGGDGAIIYNGGQGSDVIEPAAHIPQPEVEPGIEEYPSDECIIEMVASCVGKTSPAKPRKPEYEPQPIDPAGCPATVAKCLVPELDFFER